MGLHNLESQSLIELMDEAQGSLESSQSLAWLDDLLNQYSQIPGAPLGTQAEILSHCLEGLRGLFFNQARKGYVRKAGKLLGAIELNKSNPHSVYMEFVDVPDFAIARSSFTVWKGTLFDLIVSGEVVVCWHPDKDFRPVVADQVLHTGYSELGRRRRRKLLRAKSNS